MTTKLQNFLSQDPYDESGMYGTPEEKKKEWKDKSLAACNNSVVVMLPKGDYKRTSFTCKIYRHCDTFCRHAKFEEIEKRINHAQAPLLLGSRLRYEIITEDEKVAFFKKLSRGDYDHYSFPQPNDKCIVIHNNPDGAGDELWDFGYDDHDLYNEGNGFDLNFYTILKEVPEGRKISGSLGHPDLDEDIEDEKNGPGGDKEEEEEETYSVKFPCLYKGKMSDRDISLAYRTAVTQTQNITVTNEIELERAMFARANAMVDALNGSYDVLWVWGAVTPTEIESWNQNKNNFSPAKDNTTHDNVQITTITDSYSSNLDISDKPAKIISSFDAVVSRSKRGDDMDSQRQAAIMDYLDHHMT